MKNNSFKKLRRRIGTVVFVALLIAAVIWAWMPSPVRVDLARAQRGQLMITVDEEGEARAQDRYVISSPVAGHLSRIDLRDGDLVNDGEVVAMITPLPLEPRARSELLAKVQGAEAAQREAEQRTMHAKSDYEQSRRDRDRAERLARAGVISTQALEQARIAETTNANELEAAAFNAQKAASDVKVARSGLIALETGNESGIVKIKAPVRGPILRIVEKSERVVAAGTALMTLGDPRRLEVVVDVLSTDAVNIKPGALMLLEGGENGSTLRARVRLVEPQAFTKVSALGIEEQRVNVIGDFIDPPGSLGDGYRVNARIVLWQGDQVLKVPSSALFRSGDAWCVFVVEFGRTRMRTVQPGHRGPFESEILSGLGEGEEVITHPPNEIKDGSKVSATGMQ